MYLISLKNARFILGLTRKILIGVVRSNVSCGYVKVQPGRDMVFYPKSDKNWPRTGASNTTRSKQDFWPTLAELKIQAELVNQ